MGIISFSLFIYIYRSLENIFMPFAISMFIIGVYSKIEKTKLFFIIGLFSLGTYSYLQNNIEVTVSSIFGILLNLYSYLKLKQTKRSEFS